MEAIHEDNEQARLLPELESTRGFSRYAKLEHLSKYIPALEYKNIHAKTMRSRMSKRSTMLRIQMAISISVVAVYFAAGLWAVLTYPPDSRGVGTFYFGNCASVSVTNSGLHVALNIVSSLFLGAGNYCMQILVAPSRREVDKAHWKGKAMDIGVPSVKNLRHIASVRAVVWIFIGMVAMMLHILWNSSIFSSLPIVAIPRAVVTSDFQMTSDNWTASDPLSRLDWWKLPPGYSQSSLNISSIYSLQQEAVNYTRLDNKACLKQYIDPMTSTSPLIVVARNISTTQNNDSSLIDGWVSSWEGWESSQTWICRAHREKACTWTYAETFADNWTLSWPRGIQVDHCLSGEQGDNDERCGLHYSVHILGIVSLCTVLECMLICWTWFYHCHNPAIMQQKENNRAIVTMGDAIHSFLEDPSTGDGPVPPKRGTVEVKLATWRVKARVPWIMAVGPLTWVISVALFILGLLLPSLSVGSSIAFLIRSGVDVSIPTLWKQGFKVNSTMVARHFGSLASLSSSGAEALLSNILLVNSPQVLVSFLYIFYNNILTRQLVADEWVRFLREDGKKPLRVSSPVGLQRSTHSLSLPLKYSIPLMSMSILLHWLISQSLFLVQSSTFGPGPKGGRLPGFDYPARGYSLLGSILALTLGLLMVIAILLNSFVRAYTDIPAGFQLMGHNSTAIKAICQRPEKDSQAAFFPVRIGVVQSDTDEHLNKVVFSTDTEIQTPKQGEQYLQPVFVREASSTFHPAEEHQQRGETEVHLLPRRPLEEILKMASDSGVSVLFVCLGNICRSPMAEAVFRHITSSNSSSITFSTLDSAGTCAAHLGDAPDPRTMSTLKKHGITSFTHAARRVKSSDFTDFDYIIAMDRENLDSLLHSQSRVKGEKLAEVRMFGDFDGDVDGKGESEEVPDPYYGGRDGFDHVYEMVTRLSSGFMAYLEKKHGHGTN
ncbi:uncharacterized protein GIQ15_06885 [Arthroderma uncinatum]|uniref:uncharacterized protein n=1 Tax=Arthroderma uncinatum TaxID=74035 RepID=UPI00144AD316|nr:uncharacterized protein GIQ15_06885 [Arthroderma uncinatum]KAF3479909.1 hypothetical protein GIQ15_06885 [Arthroderma uncinatum]